MVARVSRNYETLFPQGRPGARALLIVAHTSHVIMLLGKSSNYVAINSLSLYTPEQLIYAPLA
jgi:hypothetical protein